MTVTSEPPLWERNATRHADPRLTGPRDPAWWYTGVRPAQCPGLGADGRMTSLPLPDLSRSGREEVLAYFDNSWTLTETLFAGLQGAESFYRSPDHNLRHPMIFYYGHPAALYVNKFRVAGLLDAPIDAYLEEILETGVDEMSWDDMSKNDMEWPSVADVHAYRSVVHRTIVKVIESTSFAPDLGRPVTMDDRAWAIFLAFEHDRIHLETSSVLIRETPLHLVRPVEAWPAPAPARRTTSDGKPSQGSYPTNETVAVRGGVAHLGKPRDFPSFGWDNEYGSQDVDVADFEASRCLVSNGEYHEFVADGGYRRPELWSDEGERWRRFRNAKWPRWWVPAGPAGLHAFRLRTTFDEIDMPWDWPVCVNYHEAKAYCTWRSDRDGRTYRLPAEAEYWMMRALPDSPGVADDAVMERSGVEMRELGVNLNLAWGSEGPVDHSPTTRHGLHDTAGNLWAWCEDVCNPLDGFAVHPYYEDFTVPCFDGLHQMILGGSFISTGDEASVWARFHFRPHFLQQSGIRLIATSSVAAPQGTATDAEAEREILDRYLLLHYGSVEDTFDRVDHPLTATHGYPRRLARRLVEEASRNGVALNRVMEVGCAVGGTSFALAQTAAKVVGVDLSPQFVETARRLARGDAIAYDCVEQGTARVRKYARTALLPEGVSADFHVADACDLPRALGSFDAVVLSNLLDSLHEPEACLRQFTDSDHFLGSGGMLLVACPWSWNDGYTDPEKWLGGRADSSSSEQQLRSLLDGAFDLVAESNEAGVLRNHRRHFEVFDAHVTVWRKR